MCLIATLIMGIIITFMDPILSIRLTELGLNPDNVGLGFAMIFFSYVLGCTLISWIGSRVKARFLITGGFAMSVIALLLSSGYLSDQLYLTFIGLFLVGLSCAGIILPSIPEATAAMSA